MSKYRTIVADPPWPYKDVRRSINRGRNAGQRKMEFPYPTMPLSEISALPVPELALLDAHLFLWTTHRFLDDAFDVARSWGFLPVSTLTWCKKPVGVGPGGLFAVTSEFVVYARRGNPARRQRVATTWWEWPRGVHSQKPEAFQDVVEAAVDGPYLEMFARRRRSGWDVWGNEVESDVELAS